jgi:oligosaccharide repeat unit polymerase
MVIQAVYISFALAGVCYFLVAKREHALSPLTMYFAGTVVFLYPGALTRTADLWYVDVETEWMAMLVIAMSIAMAIIGYKLSKSMRRRRRISDRIALEPKIPTVLLVGILGVSLLTKLYFDSDNFISKFLMNTVRSEDAVGKYVEILAYLPTALACLSVWLWDQRRTKNIQSALTVAAIFLAGVFSLSRTPVFYVLGTVVLYRIWDYPRLWRYRSWRLLMIVVIITSLPVLTFLAALIKGSNTIVTSVENEDAVEYSTVYDFAVEKQYELAVSDAYGNFLFILDHYPSVYPYEPMRSLEVLVTVPIPRSIAPWKSWSPSYHLTNQILGPDTFERTGTSLVTSFVGEMWMNWGWIAVLIGSLLVGVIANIIHSPFLRSDLARSKRTIYIMCLIVFFFVQRGDLLSTVVRGTLYVLLAYFSIKVILYISTRQPFRRTAVVKQRGIGWMPSEP